MSPTNPTRTPVTQRFETFMILLLGSINILYAAANTAHTGKLHPIDLGCSLMSLGCMLWAVWFDCKNRMRPQ